MDREQALLLDALLYEDGHRRRTEHILKVYGLARLLAEEQSLSGEERAVLQASAILHDIPIKYCKEHCGGDASQENQRRQAPRMVGEFMARAGYPPQWVPRVLELVEHHHDNEKASNLLLSLLVEADVLVNCYEEALPPEKVERLFHTEAGRRLLTAYRHGREREIHKGGERT